MKLIKLHGKFAAGRSVMVDDTDFDWLNRWRWYCVKGRGTDYAGRAGEKHEYVNGKRPLIRMHRVILNLTDPKIFGDHINFDGLNNTRDNLRPSDISQNNMNKKPFGKSKYMGVAYDGDDSPRIRKWAARLSVHGKRLYLGRFHTEKEAALAYNKAAREHYGDYPNFNIIE